MTIRQNSTAPRAAAFGQTQWKVVLAAKNLKGEEAQRAMAILCEQYHYPIYAFIRFQGRNRHDAQDLTQEFFCRLIDKEFLKVVDPEKGRFRAFLLTAVKRFLYNEREKSQAQKRGGGAVFVTWDADEAEERYCQEPSHDQTPERAFERRWALTVLSNTMADLKSEYERGGKARLLEVLEGLIVGERGDTSYAEAAKALNLSDGAVRVAVHRIRKRYGELLRERIGQTVDSEAALDEEMASLREILGRHAGGQSPP